MSLFSFFGFRKKSKVKDRATPLPVSQRATSASRPSVSSRSSDSPLVSNEAVIMASIIMSDDSDNRRNTSSSSSSSDYSSYSSSSSSSSSDSGSCGGGGGCD